MEGETEMRKIRTPSEGGKRQLEIETRVQALQRVPGDCAPLEGETETREICTPSEGGTGISTTPSEGVERALMKMWHRNGTESWEMLPLWKRGRRAMLSRRPVERVQRRRTFRNGSESREILPLWKNEYVQGSGERVIFLNLPDKISYL